MIPPPKMQKYHTPIIHTTLNQLTSIILDLVSTHLHQRSTRSSKISRPRGKTINHSNKTWNEPSLISVQFNASLDDNENYVGLKVERDRRRRIMFLSQPKHMMSIPTKFPDVDYTKYKSTPTPYLGGPGEFTKQPSTDDPCCCTNIFLSKLMFLMYAALKTRWDLLYACTYMALRITTATVTDMARLDYMLIYGFNTAH